MSEFSLPVRVYIEDTDAGGIVFYVNYLKYMERARTELLRFLGYDKAAITQHNELLVVANANIDYKRSARLDDLLDVTAAFSKVGRSYVVFDQTVKRGQELLCSAQIKVACVAQDSLKPQALPKTMLEKINHWLETEQP